MDKKIEYIKSKLQEDKKISNQANEIFENFKGGIILENKNKQKERKVIKISLQQAILAFSTFMLVVVLGGNLYAHLNGKPNLYSAIRNLFIKEARYTESEVEVGQELENSGIKLTLKTVAMDENVLITKYIAEGEKLTNEFYTYNELEEQAIKASKIEYALALGKNVDDIKYKEYSKEDILKIRKDIVAKLVKTGLSESEANELEGKAHEAYKEYMGAQIDVQDCSIEKAENLIEETIAIFEAKVSSKYIIMQSKATLQNIDINVISQKIEKDGNSYIIYNVYNVDTITDLASKFNLSIKISQIGNTNGKWNFETKLEKARLDTRVETIDFYDDNRCDNVAPSTTVEDKVRHTAVVEAKKLVISDFSTVLMVQTRIKADDKKLYEKYADSGLPCVFIILDENNKVVGTSTCSEELFSKAMSGNGDAVYTDRILLENVGKDTKKLYIKMFEQYTVGDVCKISINDPIELDIEKARSEKHIELNQNFTSKKQLISVTIPADWKAREEENKLTISSKEDVDGNSFHMYIGLVDAGLNAKELQADLVRILKQDGTEVESGEKEFAGIKGYYYTIKDEYGTVVTKVLCDRDKNIYEIEYKAIPAQYERYKEVAEQILNTIKYVEPDKTFKTFSSSNGGEVIKVYEDNVVTLTFGDNLIKLYNQMNEQGTKLVANKEYVVNGINTNEIFHGVTFVNLDGYDDSDPKHSGGVYRGQYIFIHLGSKLYLLHSGVSLENGTFEAKIVLDEGEFIANEPQKEGEWPHEIVVVTDSKGEKHQILRDGTIKKYEEPKQENSTSEMNNVTE